jgi:hypothetical protein
MARIDYASFVGQTFTNDKTHDRYLVKEYLGDKLYTIQFVDENGVFLKDHEQTAEKYANVVNGKCKDLKAKKIASAIKKKQQYTSRNRCSRKSVESYERIPDLAEKVVMSIDGSTYCTGYAISKGGQNITVGQIECGKDTAQAHRMAHMALHVGDLIKQYGVEVVFYEDVIPKNLNTMKILGRLQGMVEYACFLAGIKKVQMISPISWKTFCGFTLKVPKGIELRAVQKAESMARASEHFGHSMKEDESDAFNMLEYCMTLEKKED